MSRPYRGGAAVSARLKSWRAKGAGSAGREARVGGEEEAMGGGWEESTSRECTTSHVACSPCRPTLPRRSAAFCLCMFVCVMSVSLAAESFD